MHSGRHSTPIVDLCKRGQLKSEFSQPLRRPLQVPAALNNILFPPRPMHNPALLPVDAPIYYSAIPPPHCHICLFAPNPNPNTAPARTVCHMNPPTCTYHPVPASPNPISCRIPYRSDTQPRHPRSPQSRHSCSPDAGECMRGSFAAAALSSSRLTTSILHPASASAPSSIEAAVQCSGRASAAMDRQTDRCAGTRRLLVFAERHRRSMGGVSGKRAAQQYRAVPLLEYWPLAAAVQRCRRREL